MHLITVVPFACGFLNSNIQATVCSQASVLIIELDYSKPYQSKCNLPVETMQAVKLVVM